MERIARDLFFSSAAVYGDYEGVMEEEVMDTVAIKQMNDYAINGINNDTTIKGE